MPFRRLGLRSSFHLPAIYDYDLSTYMPRATRVKYASVLSEDGC